MYMFGYLKYINFINIAIVINRLIGRLLSYYLNHLKIFNRFLVLNYYKILVRFIYNLSKLFGYLIYINIINVVIVIKNNRSVIIKLFRIS